jgi:hypothetical protein
MIAQEPQNDTFLDLAAAPVLGYSRVRARVILERLGGANLVLPAPLAPPDASWPLLTHPGASWLLLPPGNSWRFLGPPGASCASWRFLAPPGASWRFLALPSASWRLLASPGASWRRLAAPGASWRLLAALVSQASMDFRAFLRLGFFIFLPICFHGFHGSQIGNVTPLSLPPTPPRPLSGS